MAVLFFKNRWLRLFVYLWTNIVSAFIFGWPPLSAILFKSGAYAWQCDDTWWIDNDQPCVRQYNSVQALYTVSLLAISIISILAGITYDRLGPLISGSLGQLMFLVGWSMLSFSSQNLQFYIPAFLLMGASINFTTFTTSVACDFFPKRPGLIISALLSAQCFSNVVPVCMEELWKAFPTITFRFIVLSYLGILVPSQILYILSLPVRRVVLPGVDQFDDVWDVEFDVDDYKVESKKELTLPTPIQTFSLARGDTDQGGTGNDDDGKNAYSPTTLSDVSMSPQTRATPTTMQSPSQNNCTFHKNDPSANLAAKAQSLTPISSIISFFVEEEKSFVLMDGVGRSMVTLGPFKSGSRQLLREVCTPEFILFTIFYSIVLLATAYYPTTVQAQFGTGVSHFMGIMTAIQGVPSLILALLVDYTGTIPISIGLTCCSALVCVFAVVGVLPLQYLTATLHVVCISFLYTTKYTYVQEIFATPNFGAIAGLIATFAGTILPINIVIQNYADRTLTFLSYLVCLSLLLPMLGYLWWRQRQGVNYKHYSNDKHTKRLQQQKQQQLTIV